MIRSKTPVPGPRAWSSSPASRSASASRRRLRKRIPPPIEVRLLTVAEGELIYVNATDCVQRPYRAGTSFVDPGRPNVHTAFNSFDGVTVVVATFLEVSADGPLTIAQGVEAPTDL